MNRYMLRLTLMLSALVAGSATAVAQSETPTGVKVHGNVFGGGNEADVKTNTTVNMSTGQVLGNVYGGGNIGSVGTYTSSADMKTFTFTANTGACTVTINGGTIGTGVDQSADGTFANGNVYGAGKGEADTYWCEKAMSYKTTVTINAGTIGGTVYGGGQIGRVENDATVTIGDVSPTNDDPVPTIAGNVFGAGAGVNTHGYSALLRGDTKVTVQGYAQIGLNVYGGGEKASVGRFKIVGGLPAEPADDGSGDCIVNIRGNAAIGSNTDDEITDKGNVFGSCQGVAAPTSFTAYDTNYKSMQAVALKAPSGTEDTAYKYVEGSDNKYYWEYYPTIEAYQGFLNTLALASHPVVTIGGALTNETTGAVTASGNPIVKGSVYGGGQRGITLGTVAVNIAGGTVNHDVYGGGALADTNKGNQTAEKYDEATVTEGVTVVTGMYTRSGEGTDASPYKYTIIEEADTKAASGTTYYTKASQSSINTTTVDLTGGLIKGDTYGGGLGQKTGFNSATSDIAAVVWGDIDVTLNGTAFYITYDNAGTTENPVNVVKSGRVFGCNNLWGSPQGDVTVTVNRTVEGNTPRTTNDENGDKRKSETDSDHKYELAAVYGGGNLAPYTTSGKKAQVNIYGCDDTSILTVYGGGNAAPVPETDVEIYSTYEIGSVFGGGNGKDKYKNDNGWQTNPGANVNGNTKTLIYGGTVHEAYGASNEKGTVYGSVSIDVAGTNPDNCTLDVAKIVGAGKNADVNGDLIMVMGCKPATKIPLLFAGADNANVNGDVELTITSGWFEKVFGGNNENGAIMGHIKLNIEETGDCGTPITIDELYLGGNQAAYSQYGYYLDGTNPDTGKPILKPRTAAMAAITDPEADGYTPAITTAQYGSEVRKTAPYDAPELNIISCTYIGQVFGGGYGERATIYGDPTVNINMEPGAQAVNIDRDGVEGADNVATALGEIGDVYGGGNAAPVYGNTTVNIGTATTVQMTSIKDDEGNLLATQPEHTVTGVYITGNVYGGGKLADVGKYHEEDDPVVANRKNNVIDITGNTNVNICAKYNSTSKEWESVAEGTSGVFIGGNVYGGGKGADTTTDAADIDFYCADAMVLGNKDDANGGTFVRIGNGTIGNGTTGGNVYGGGEISRVEQNTAVWIGYGEGVATGTPTSAPDIKGTVFGAGAGLRTHGYSALVRGHSSVTIEGNAKIEQSVYGGGEMATVGRYNVVNNVAESNISGGACTVIVGGYAEIGPDDMVMNNTTTGKPDDYGHVFGAGKGIQPYEGFDDAEQPWSKTPDGKTEYTKFSEIGSKLPKDYATYIRTLALVTEAEVTIKDHAFVKACVFGGSENGFVQEDTHVTIQDHCQIGNGYVQMADNGTYLDKLSTPLTPLAVNRRYTEDEWTAGHLIMGTNDRQALKDLVSPGNTPTYYTSSLPECASWPYGQAANDADKYAPYDKYADTTGYDSKGGRTTADDGHTFYGQVFGGGSGYYPYKPGRWFEDAGAVYGNTTVEITGGHILTSVYGGNEMTDVGKYALDSDGKPTTTITSGGKCTITMSGGTIGVPRTLKQIDAHPVTCYIFGAGKGDQRVLFNKSTNVGDVEVNITGGTIYGSVFGGGEDGHVMRNVTMTIGKQTTTGEGDQAVTTTSGPTIGTWGTSYVDGNVFGGGRGFGGDAYTAGNVAGSITMDIKGGTMLGSIYGGGRLGSVGYGLYTVSETDGYGKLRENKTMDDGTDGSSYFTKGRGNINITISGGTIGNTHEYIVPKTGEGGNTPSSITETDFTKWTAEQWDTWKEHNHVPKTVYDTATGRLIHSKGGNVFAGGMGRREKLDGVTPIPYDESDSKSIDWHKLGNVKSTSVTVSGSAWIKSNVYGGGELGAVRSYYEGSLSSPTKTEGGNTEININGGTVGTMIGPSINGGTKDTGSTSGDGRYTFGSVYGGGYGSEKDILDDPSTPAVVDPIPYNKNMENFAALIIGDTKVKMTGGTVLGSVFGGGEVACVGGSSTVEVSGGAIGVNELRNNGYVLFGGATMGNVFGGGRGSMNAVNAGLVRSSTTVNISGTPEIYHNVYGGGALGSVGWFTFTDGKPTACSDNTGTATVTVTGGTIGINGHDNGMVNGSSRGGEGNPTGSLLDQVAWVKNTVVTIGTAATPASGTEGEEGYIPATPASGPDIKGSVYGGGENGHNFRNSEVTIHGGTIGYDATATYDNGNVYGAGCGTDTYTEDGVTKYNPMAGCVWGNTSITIDGGHVLHNVYGGGAMGSVGTYTVSSDMRTFTWGEPYNNTGVCEVTVSGGEIGNVFGGGKGKEESFWCEKAIAYKTIVNVSNGTVNGNVYGGGEVGRVETDTQVKIGLAPGEGGGTSEPWIYGSVFGGGAGVETHGYSALVRGNTTVTIDQNAHVTHSVYGGGEIASVGKYGLDAQNKPSILQGGGYCYVTVQGNATIGDDVFGAGKGVTPHFDKDNADHSKRSRRMTLYNATGFPDGTGTWEYCENYPNNHQGTKFVWDYFQTESDYSTYLETLALATHPEVTIDGNAAVSGSVFGGGELGLTKGSVTVNIEGGTIVEDVYGGGSLANTNTTNLVDFDGDGKTETVDPTTTVNLKGGTVTRNVYGGGLGRLAKDAVAEVLYTAEDAEVIAGTKNVGDIKTPADDAVSAVEAKVYGDVTVELNKPTTPEDDTTYGDCEVKGSIFGCNNLNGSPQKDVTVHIYKTVTKSSSTVQDKPSKNTNTYELTAVYGGGNLAAYYPDGATTSSTAKANVIIDGCGLTSIKTVYGGGNAASVPATDVIVNGTYEIGQVFGGGNGYDNYQLDGKWYQNPGANVGYKNYTHLGTGTGTAEDLILAVNNTNPDASTKENRIANYAYGIGKAHATIYGGTVHEVYGGSNSRGNVRVEARATLEDLGCDFTVGEAYGGGRNAPQDGDAVLEIGCISGLEKAYGGAANADINGNVVLNITNGTYGQVFGGNNAGGAIRGSITVNIEETGCRPIIIGELYGGGCNAAYSVYGYDANDGVLTTGSNPVADPVVNVKSFTSIGNVFGGGYGATATMVGNPTVNINVLKGKYAETYKGSDNVVSGNHKVYDYPVPSHAKGAIGAIQNVFGGGNAANVIGTPHVNVGTKVGEVITLTSMPIEDGEGRTSTQDDWVPSYQLATVEGVDIRGNVFGGGNNAEVTGNTEVVIGKNSDVKTYSFTSYNAQNDGTAWSSGLAQTTGVTKNGLAEVEILTNGSYGEFVGRKFYVSPTATTDGSVRTQLMDADGNGTSLYVATKPYELKTYSFTSHSAESGGTQYSTGTAAPTGNYKTFNSKDYMQIQVLTNPGEASWVGKTFYVQTNADTNGTARTQLYKANGDAVGVWVSISVQE